jgi:hypothetical protein
VSGPGSSAAPSPAPESPAGRLPPRPRIRRTEVAFLVVIAVVIIAIGVLAGGYTVTPSGYLVVRNGTTVPITVEVTQGGFLFLRSSARYQVEPGSPGSCLTLVRLEQGAVDLRVVGPEPGRETTGRAEVAAGTGAEVTVDVSPDGRVTFGVPLPSDPPSCGRTGG